MDPRIAVEAAQQRRLGRRDAATSAAFFLPHLRPGLRLLDVGCGPGSITIGLAEAVAPGEVVGLDHQSVRVEQARALVAERAIANVRFEVGSAYELPFPDAAFDAAFAHTLLMHLAEPQRGLKEIKRVLRPGGVIGVADDDQATLLISPPTPLLEELCALNQRWLLEVRTAHPLIARHHRQTLLAAGFARVVAGVSTATFGVYGTPEETRAIGGWWASFVDQVREEGEVVRRGWVDAARLEAMAAAAVAWGERPDAFMAMTGVTAVGWTDGGA
jgi:ubiquinone/menaquinone biosynthesis C-methylase UbiE